MREALFSAYNRLTADRQQNVAQFIYFLIDQQEKQEVSTTQKDSGDFEAMIDSFAGCTHVWDDIDVMKYQKQLRGEYRVD